MAWYEYYRGIMLEGPGKSSGLGWRVALQVREFVVLKESRKASEVQ